MLFVNKLKVLTLMACLVLVGQAFALDCATGTGWGDFLTQEATKGSDDYYEIDTPEKLAWISCKMKHDNGNFKTAKIKLTKSIDMQGHQGKVFIPIAAGTGIPPSFNGIFDGQGFTISNLYIKASEINNAGTSTHTGKSKNGNAAYAQNIGLFGIISKSTVNKVDYIGTVKNLTLKDVQIYAASSAGSTGINSDKPISVGSVVGWVSDGGIIENCVASGTIETSGATNRVGGIAGNVKSVTISNCVSSVSVTASGASTNVGGIVGALRNGGNINISSCVYSGNNLYTVDGSVGAIAGSYESVNKLSTEDLYYSDEFCKELDEGEACSGIGTKPDTVTFNANSTDNLNSEEVVCNLNCGSWDEGTCTGDTSDVWSIGQMNISMNGSDGFKITFSANEGSFDPGAKTSKILAKNATITADEIGVPTREGKKFAGWATTADAEEPMELGVASAARTIYAVWYDFYEVTFKTGCDTAFSDAKFPDSTKTKTISVAKHGVVSVEGFSVPTVYEIGAGENKAKYYFTGWAYEPKSFGKDDEIGTNDTLHLSGIDVTAPVTLYAVWTKAPTFSVTFDASLHGKTDVHFVRMVTEGETVSRPDTVITDAGYKVVGWCEVENCTEENEYSFADSLKGNLVLHARWEIESYSIKYELDGGINAEDNPSAYNVNSGDIVFAAPTKEGAKFEGWFYDANLTNPATQIDAGSTGDKTIYAKWTVATYTIQYLSGTVISATVPGTTKTYGETITLKDAPSQFAVGGCTFDGWSKVDYGQEGYAVDYAFGAKYADNANLKLFPHWTSCGTYTITYELYGVEATNRNPSTYTGPVKVTLENAFVSDNPVKMDNWYLEPTFKTSIRYLQGINKDMTLYAKWYSVITFQPGAQLKASNKDAGKVEKQKNLNASYTLGIPNDKYKITNYTLDGWSLSDGGEKVYDKGFAYRDNVNITLYPHWTANTHTITYNNVETSELPEGYPVTYTHEASVTLPVPSRKGYEFLGWYVDGEFNGDAVVEIPANQTEDKEFFAKWSDPIEYSITYVIDGEPTVLTPDEFTVVDNVTLAVPEMADGYIFDGWYLDEGMTGEKVTGFGAGTYAANQTFYGKWIRTYRITYVDADGLENPNPTSYTVLENDLELQPVSKSGFKFLGWFNDNDELVESISKNSAEDITLTAHWAEFPVLVSTYGGIEIFENEDGTKTAEIDGTSEKRVNIPTADNISVNQVVFNRDFSGGVKSTVMFPFTVSLNDVSGGEFWEFMAMEYSSETGWLFRIKEPDDNELKANKPYIFIADQESKNIEFNLSNSVSFSTDIMNPSVNNGWAFKGVYEKVSFNEDHPEWKYAYGYSGEQKRNVTKGSFIRLKSTGFEKIDLAPMRAYLVYDKSLAKSARISDNANIGSLPEFIDVEIVGKKGLAIGGGVLNTTTGELKMDRWYDLRGRKLNGKPTTQGTYYYNGKRIIVR